jgi:hypothetical protein
MQSRIVDNARLPFVEPPSRSASLDLGAIPHPLQLARPSGILR